MERKRSSKTKVMNIVIVGCGKVGISLVDKLSREGNNITVVDKNPARVQMVTDTYDVIGVVGNGANFAVQTEAGVAESDIFISVTGSDELNLLCCIAAKRSSNCAAIARVRTPDYSEDLSYLKGKLGLTMIINPEKESSQEIVRILCLPTAIGVSSFARGRAEMVRIKVPKNNMLHDKTLAQLGPQLGGSVLICAVERDGEVHIPAGSFRLKEGDQVNFICPTRDSRSFLERIGFNTRQVRNTLIIGGSRAAYYLARQLIQMGVEVCIIENNRDRCEELSDLLPKATIIHGDGTDADVLREAGIEYAESVVPLTGIDEENILLTLHTQEVSGAKVVTKINRMMFPEAIEKLNLGSVVCPKDITTNAIVAYVRSRSASKDSNLETLLRLFDNRVEAIEFVAQPGSPVLDIPLKSLSLRDGLLISCINRKGRILIPGGDECIQAEDSVIIVTTHTGLRELEDILV